MKVALCCIAKDEIYIQEWLDYNFKLGFDHIFIYQNDWRCSIEHPNITKINYDGENKQNAAYNDFINTYSNYYDWAAFIDCDEFIVLKKHNNIKELILDYVNQPGININWKMFGNMDKMKREGDSLIKQFTKSQTGTNEHIKQILNLSVKHRFGNPHFTNYYTMNVNGNMVGGPFNHKGSDNVSYIAHYYHKSYEDWELRIKRGRADARNTVNRALTEWHEKHYNDNDVDNFDVMNFMYGGD